MLFNVRSLSLGFSFGFSITITHILRNSYYDIPIAKSQPLKILNLFKFFKFEFLACITLRFSSHYLILLAINRLEIISFLASLFRICISALQRSLFYLLEYTSILKEKNIQTCKRKVNIWGHIYTACYLFLELLLRRKNIDLNSVLSSDYVLYLCVHSSF